MYCDMLFLLWKNAIFITYELANIFLEETKTFPLMTQRICKHFSIDTKMSLSPNKLKCISNAILMSV